MIRISDVKPVGGGGATKHPVKPEAPAKDNRSDISDASPIARTLDVLLKDAIAASATTVHIEPHGKDVSVRYRIDGVLRPGKLLSRGGIARLAGRVKLLAHLDIDEDRLPQDGRFETEVAKKRCTIRASLMPVADGEKIVLHIIDQSAAPHDLENLGFWGQSKDRIVDALERIHGLVIVTGPSGSGKTSTMYGMTHMSIDPTHSVATVEDTIEYRIPGVNQTPVNLRAGMAYSQAMRAVLHQDPNIVMVSELREPETAEMTVQAALAGKLLFAGIANADIAAALQHLVALRVEPFLVASAVRVVVNQRLVRRLCAECRQGYAPDAEEFAVACATVGLKPAGAIAHLANLQKVAAKELDVKSPQAAIANGKFARLWRASTKGCEACGYTGYHGRIVIAEALTVTPEIQKLIFASASGAALYEQAVADGMLPLPLDGFVKACLGLTSVEEVVRVVSRR